MSGPARLPFLADEPWRVAVVSPTGRYARNQVAGMIEAETPLIGGLALGRIGRVEVLRPALLRRGVLHVMILVRM